jgi:predicted ATPase
MAVEGMQFPWRWDGGTISTNLDVIWGISVQKAQVAMEDRHAALATVFVLTGNDDAEPILDAVRNAVAALPESYAGASLLPNHCGLWARILATDRASLRAAMDAGPRRTRRSPARAHRCVENRGEWGPIRCASGATPRFC